MTQLFINIDKAGQFFVYFTDSEARAAAFKRRGCYRRIAKEYRPSKVETKDTVFINTTIHGTYKAHFSKNEAQDRAENNYGSKSILSGIAEPFSPFKVKSKVSNES